MVQFDMLKDDINKSIQDINKNDIVVIMSAYSNPGWIFQNQKKAYELNVIATKKLIESLTPHGCKICFMSSVEVFDGSEDAIIEFSNPNPSRTADPSRPGGSGSTRDCSMGWIRSSCPTFSKVSTSRSGICAARPWPRAGGVSRPGFPGCSSI